MCAAHLARHLFTSPDVRLFKGERAMGVLEEKRYTKEGTAFREHALRRCAGNTGEPPPLCSGRSPLPGRWLRTKTPQIFPSTNAALSGAPLAQRRGSPTTCMRFLTRRCSSQVSTCKPHFATGDVSSCCRSFLSPVSSLTVVRNLQQAFVFAQQPLPRPRHELRRFRKDV